MQAGQRSAGTSAKPVLCCLEAEMVQLRLWPHHFALGCNNSSVMRGGIWTIPSQIQLFLTAGHT